MRAKDKHPKITVSYRRADSAMAGRIFDRLVQRFGKNSLFIDIDNIPFGGDFRKHVDEALKSSDLLIAMVGPKWMGGEGKEARITRESDPVRVEIETALKQETPILPVLLDNARMPEPSDLPEGMREFAYRNAVDVESGRDFDVHVDRVIKAIEQILGAEAVTPAESAPAVSGLVSPVPPPAPQQKQKRSSLPLLLIGGLAALAAIGAALWFARDRLSTAEEIDPTTGTAYCEDFKQVIEESRTDFNALLGRPDGDRIWLSRTQLPGWDNCRIADWTTEGKIIRYFGCELPSVATVEELHAKRDTGVIYLQSCLGKSWARKRDTFSNGATETSFKLGSDEPIARFRESIYADARGNILRIEVDVPSSLFRAAPAEAAEPPAPTPTPPQPPETADAVCSDLKRAVASASSNFVNILGPSSGDAVWISRVQLQGWQDCTVQEWTTGGQIKRYFTCLRGPFANAAALRAEREQANTFVKPCLGTDWAVRNPEFSDKTIHSIYFMGPDDPEVRLREVYYEKADEWILRLDVDAPPSQAIPAPPEPTSDPPKTSTPPPEAVPNQPLPPPPPPAAAPNAPITPPPAAN